jgi:hypothetical protein
MTTTKTQRRNAIVSSCPSSCQRIFFEATSSRADVTPIDGQSRVLTLPLVISLPPFFYFIFLSSVPLLWERRALVIFFYFVQLPIPHDDNIFETRRR